MRLRPRSTPSAISAPRADEPPARRPHRSLGAAGRRAPRPSSSGRPPQPPAAGSPSDPRLAGAAADAFDASSTIIDLPGDPALVRRAAATLPRPIALAVPAGARRHRPDPGIRGLLRQRTADARRRRLSRKIHRQRPAGRRAERGARDEYGASLRRRRPTLATTTTAATRPPQNAQAAPVTGANTQQLDTIEGGENGRPQLKEAELRPTVAQKISELLIESGFEKNSAAAVEAAAKRVYNIQSLRSGSVALAVGAVDSTGAYRVAQLAMFQDGEYVGTIAEAERGDYGEGAEPTLPPGFLDNSERPPAGAHFNLADGVYSAGLRSAIPEAVIREAVHLIAAAGRPRRAARRRRDAAPDLRPHAAIEEAPASRVVYVGLSGAAAAVDCYAFVIERRRLSLFRLRRTRYPPARHRLRSHPVARRCRPSARRAAASSPTAGPQRPAAFCADQRRAGDLAVRHALSPDPAYPAASRGHRFRRAGRFARCAPRPTARSKSPGRCRGFGNHVGSSTKALKRPIRISRKSRVHRSARR